MKHKALSGEYQQKMTNTQAGIDRNGHIVKEDDYVYLFSIRPSIIKRLAGSELADVSSMLGKTVKVFDIYDNGQVWVSLDWIRPDGLSEIHAIAVDAEAIELVSNIVTPVGAAKAASTKLNGSN
ncbi:hypothetical protein [Undibacterium sp.]|uniref:hypothetical protein n=1 Tax=Undibacterium sp. TaxID=1914977 RepID=UPI002731DB4B|nr:hypothetical protein [Undibacterium sp.]MDP1977304.1 hypothetical protein [Undibacterium sp.]